MIQGKAEDTKFESQAFEFIKSLDADVNVELFSKTVASVLKLPLLTTIIQLFFLARPYKTGECLLHRIKK